MSKKHRSHFVKPRTVRLELADGEWVEIRERLTFGEAQALQAAVFSGIRPDANAPTGQPGQVELSVDMARFAINRLSAYLLDWSLKDERDKPVPVNRASIEALDPEMAAEIGAAIDTFLTEQATKEEERVGEESSILIGVPPS